MWELNTDSDWICGGSYISHPLIFKSHSQINQNEQTHSEIRFSWNDLSSPSGMKRIDEKLIDIDLVVDIKSKSDFRPENHDL